MAEDKSSAEKKDNSRVHMKICCNGSDRWTGLNIAGVVAGFVFLGPMGLLILFWVLSGRNVVELPAALRQAWFWIKDKKGGDWTFGTQSMYESDNRVFNEYQQTQRDRIQEIRDEMNRRREQFDIFRADAKRRADEEEFRRFMNESPLRGEH